MSNDTRSVVESYFNAWTNKRTSEAYELLADNLEFRGPGAHFQSASEFKPGLEGFAALTKWAKIVSFVVENDRAALLYDCELPSPVGVLRVSSFFRVENGKIRSYDAWFDAENFRKLMH